MDRAGVLDKTGWGFVAGRVPVDCPFLGKIEIHHGPWYEPRPSSHKVLAEVEGGETVRGVITPDDGGGLTCEHPGTGRHPGRVLRTAAIIAVKILALCAMLGTFRLCPIETLHECWLPPGLHLHPHSVPKDRDEVFLFG